MGKSIKIKNDSRGPLHILKTWEETSEHKVVASTYKREGDNIQRNQRVVKKDLHDSFLLLPGEVSAALPEAAARSEQIAGLHRAKMLRVFPA